jgi:hypothetical protein
MFSTKRLLFLFSFFVVTTQLQAQYVQANKEEIIALTPDWKGERFPDGRPKVPDDILKRMKPVSIEEAWEVVNPAGYHYQIAEGWDPAVALAPAVFGPVMNITGSLLSSWWHSRPPKDEVSVNEPETHEVLAT